jgi:hypothetical protein
MSVEVALATAYPTSGSVAILLTIQSKRHECLLLRGVEKRARRDARVVVLGDSYALPEETGAVVIHLFQSAPSDHPLEHCHEQVIRCKRQQANSSPGMQLLAFMEEYTKGQMHGCDLANSDGLCVVKTTTNGRFACVQPTFRCSKTASGCTSATDRAPQGECR